MASLYSFEFVGWEFGGGALWELSCSEYILIHDNEALHDDCPIFNLHVWMQAIGLTS